MPGRTGDGAVHRERRSAFAEGGDVFCGPINDVDGTERVADGVCLTDEELQQIDWFVEGVVSGVP